MVFRTRIKYAAAQKAELVTIGTEFDLDPAKRVFVCACVIEISMPRCISYGWLKFGPGPRPEIQVRAYTSPILYTPQPNHKSLVRPRYVGTGVVILQSSVGGYYAFEVGGEDWILENGAYWASDGEVTLGLYREAVIPSLWAGEGFIDYQTRLGGRGIAVLNADGPVREVSLNDESISVEGKLVIARTAGLRYRVQRPVKHLIGFWLSGESIARTYSGTGRVLMSTTPYWNRRLLTAASR